MSGLQGSWLQPLHPLRWSWPRPAAVPARSSNDPRGWRDRCQEGLRAIELVNLIGKETISPREMREAGEHIPRLATILEEQLQHARKLRDSNIEGTEEMADYFRRITAAGVSAMLSIDRELLKEELGWLRGSE